MISSVMPRSIRQPEPVQEPEVQTADSGEHTADREAVIRSIILRAAIWMISSEIFSGISLIMEPEARPHGPAHRAGHMEEPEEALADSAVLTALTAEISSRKAAM